MAKDDSDTSQLRFENGRLVEDSDESESDEAKHQRDPVEPNAESGFLVEAKSGALEVNDELVDAVKTYGRKLKFGSHNHAEMYASQLSVADGSLRVQTAPKNDPSDVDAYFLADHNPSIKEPADIDDETWTFDVGANLYGALGESILLGSPKPHALVYFVRQDLDVDEDDLERGLNVDVSRCRLLSPESLDGSGGWTPDCVVEVSDGGNGELLERYYCEIKTGGASFERSQVEAMEALASDERVLKIRVIIENLPDQYSLRIHEIDSPAD